MVGATAHLKRFPDSPSSISSKQVHKICPMSTGMLRWESHRFFASSKVFYRRTRESSANTCKIRQRVEKALSFMSVPLIGKWSSQTYSSVCHLSFGLFGATIPSICQIPAINANFFLSMLKHWIAWQDWQMQCRSILDSAWGVPLWLSRKARSSASKAGPWTLKVDLLTFPRRVYTLLMFLPTPVAIASANVVGSSSASKRSGTITLTVPSCTFQSLSLDAVNIPLKLFFYCFKKRLPAIFTTIL